MNRPSGPLDASESEASEVALAEDIARLASEIQGFVVEQAEAVRAIRDLRNAEDLATQTFYAAEIFTQQQRKLRLETEIMIRRNKINRLRLGAGLVYH